MIWASIENGTGTLMLPDGKSLAFALETSPRIVKSKMEDATRQSCEGEQEGAVLCGAVAMCLAVGGEVTAAGAYCGRTVACGAGIGGLGIPVGAELRPADELPDQNC